MKAEYTFLKSSYLIPNTSFQDQYLLQWNDWSITAKNSYPIQYHIFKEWQVFALIKVWLGQVKLVG
jgi:hypothetical protein